MATTTIAGQTYDVNEEGFLTDPQVWTEELGTELAKLIGIEMTDAHWKAIRFLREDYGVMGETRHAAPGQHPGRHPGQGPLRAVPQEARQEDGLRRGPAEAQGLRLSRPPYPPLQVRHPRQGGRHDRHRNRPHLRPVVRRR